MKKRWMILGLVLAAMGVVEANPVCSSCGREASTADAKVCSHCQTPFPASKVPAVAEASPSAESSATAGEVALMGEGDAFTLLKNEYLTARKYETADKKNPKPNLAFFHYRNALALASLARVTDERQRAALSDSVHRTLAAITRYSEPCPVCKGARDLTLKAPDVGQATGLIGSRDYLKKVVKCPMCKGTGEMPGYRNYANMTRYLAEGRRAFDTFHQAAGDRKVGYAWVSEALAATLNARDRANIASAYGAPCPKCGWTGLEPCGLMGGTGCKGEGVVKCKALNCKNGWVETTVGGLNSSGGTRGYNANRRQKKEVHVCDVCGGAAMVVCEACGGARLQPCRKCGGEGLAPLCNRCNGTGLMSCRKCSGSGKFTPPGRDKVEGDCPDCHGIGEVPCQGCNGVGRRTGGF